MAACTGKFKLTQSENFEEFMKVLGVGLVTRKLGNKSSPTVTITEEAGQFTFKQESLVKTSEIKFKINQEFDELTADGRQGNQLLIMLFKPAYKYFEKQYLTYFCNILVKSLMTLKADNVMVHEMRGTNGGKDSVCVREFFGDKMVATCKCEDIETVRTYTAV